MIKDGIIQLALFDERLCEISHNEVRYILRRIPVRVQEIAANRASKLESVNKVINKQNMYLAEHPRARIETALKKVDQKAKALKIDSWAEAEAKGRTIHTKIDTGRKDAEALLDGCYVIKTDLPASDASAHIVHSRYKGLSEVEFAFRTMKTVLLEMRGIFVRTCNHTRAHVFIIMLAYLLAYHLRRLWYDVELTVEEGINELASICGIEVISAGQPTYQTIPEPRERGKILLSKLGISLPDAIPCRNVNVITRKKLVSERKIKRFQVVISKK